MTDHSVDVAAVAEALLGLPTIRARLSALAERELSDVDVARLCFFVGLHDAGKVNHGFQAKLMGRKPEAGHIGPLWSILRSPSFRREEIELQQDVLGALLVLRWRTWFESKDAALDLWAVILAHHGSLPADDALRCDVRFWRARDGYDPLAALKDVAEIVAGMFPNAFVQDSQPLPHASRFQHAFAGLVTLADWLGSDSSVFRFAGDGAPLRVERVEWARREASALMSRRWFDPLRARAAAARCAMDFEKLFPGLPEPRTPRPAQAELLKARLPRPGQVTVLEAETGSGKTEAALIHFLRLFRKGDVDGLYFALPTRAAAVQIHRRITEIVRRWLGDAAPPVGLAVPGYLRVDDREGNRLPDGFGVLWGDAPDRDRTWVVENAKRYLSGAVMVGTVDQVLMGGIRVRHAPFRSGPMLRLLLCVDEVHASDSYMTELLRNVLDQHRAAGGHAILMSATLGSVARLRLLGGGRVEVRQVPDPVVAAAAPYPSIQNSGEELRALPSGHRPARGKRVAVELRDPETDSGTLLARLKWAGSAGATVLFIRNKVDDARETVKRLEEMGAPLLRCQGRIAPHHGRFAPEDRRLLDQALERALSPTGEREGVIAVTTQTAEQSLDIDADWLVTDVAPGDVLLQRIGRLHRHDRGRERGFEMPLVTVLSPTPDRLAGALNDRGEVRRGHTFLGLGGVYANIVGVLATRGWLQSHGEIRVPEHNRQLVEAATHPWALTDFAGQLGDPWPAHLRDVEGKTGAAATVAKLVEVDWSSALTENQPVEDMRAATRLGLRDRRAELAEPLLGPFGRLVHVLRVPGWMVEGEPGDTVAADIMVRDGEIRFRFGSKSFRYDRLGLTNVGPDDAS